MKLNMYLARQRIAVHVQFEQTSADKVGHGRSERFNLIMRAYLPLQKAFLA